jgi:threonine synthase
MRWKQASGVSPALPAWLGDLMERPEKFTVLPSDIENVEDYAAQHPRGTRA